ATSQPCVRRCGRSHWVFTDLVLCILASLRRRRFQLPSCSAKTRRGGSRRISQNCQNCCLRSEIRGACGVPRGENHDATNATCDLRFGYGRNQLCDQQCGTNVSPAVSPSKKKAQLEGRRGKCTAH